MGRTVNIGAQSFVDMREHGDFMVDKTSFVRDWWLSRDQITLITRPRRFGKTLNLSMVEAFFSTKYAGRADLFEGLAVWDDPQMRALQGTVPVVFVSFADVKGSTYGGMLRAIRDSVAEAFDRHGYLEESPALTQAQRERYALLRDSRADDADLPRSLRLLCSLLERHWGARPIILLDEYDTPMQEAWARGFWNEASDFMRELFNSTFTTNDHLGRALLTGITRVAKESIFSDLNNLEVVTTTSESYETAFGFTEAEVFSAMDEMGLADREGVKRWYDGFVFGRTADIYNPWSVTNYLKKGRLDPYWADTSGNALVSECIARGDWRLKEDFKTLLEGGTVTRDVDEQVVFQLLPGDPDAVWGLLLATGYLKCTDFPEGGGRSRTLSVTNYETAYMFDRMVEGWFRFTRSSYGDFCDAMLVGNAGGMDSYLARVARDTFSFFDTGGDEPERFTCGFVLGLVVRLRGRYFVESNREGGDGRFDVALTPRDPGRDPGVVLEFKTCDRGENLGDAACDALGQIAEKRYVDDLVAHGVPAERIHRYGVAFCGKESLVKGA